VNVSVVAALARRRTFKECPDAGFCPEIIILKLPHNRNASAQTNF
jgi:hypothetical protein